MIVDPKPGDLSMSRLKCGKTHWRTEPGHVEKCGDDLWIAEKFQSNLEIAGSLRNSFRASVDIENLGGRALFGLGAPSRVTEFYQTPNAVDLSGSQTASDKIRSRKGNSPDTS
jgi:hypothetical protein